MVKRQSEDLEKQRELLSKTLKLIRGVRRLRASMVATKMSMKLRTYYSFEDGDGPLEIARIYSFAQATDSDAVSIFEAVMLEDPEHALRCMESKARAIELASFRRFSDRVGDRMTNIPTRAFIETYRRTYDILEEHLDKRDESTERWLEENQSRFLPPKK